MSRPRFHPEARRDFDDAVAFIADRSPAAAARFAVRAAEALELIGTFPDAGRKLAGRYRAVPMRPFPYDLVYRREDDAAATVLAVAHHRRRPRYWRNREQ